MDGLGALILVPTRELGIQAFEVLRSFANYHDLSAALIIGGKDLETEQDHIKTLMRTETQNGLNLRRNKH